MQSMLPSLLNPKFSVLIVCLICIFFLSGCIRLQAGYYKQTPKERDERTVGIDTGKIFESKQTQGSISS